MNPAPPSRWRLQRFESLASTQDLAVTLAQAGEPARCAILAARQTHARGSRGRDWTTLPGNLALSVLLRPAGPASDAGHWALLAAVAVIETLDGPGLSLKWPNDVLRDGRKLGGILIDTALGPAGRLDWLVIGIGVNLGAAPGQHASIKGNPDEVAAALLARLDDWDRIRLLDGFAPIRRAWLDRGPAPGTHLQLRLGAQIVGGAFDGLDDQGALLLQSGGRVRAFPTGEILQAEHG
ncbi:MAG: biotin--[acetyl-CoA-carboxylase] ligase [Gemmatimonadaceae bacterium]|nr:biotin--[acetyl-CoA-carboxylase] ligase [Acetobacteraceae bacterium]